jgi:hypothetical protein
MAKGKKKKQGEMSEETAKKFVEAHDEEDKSYTETSITPIEGIDGAFQVTTENGDTFEAYQEFSDKPAPRQIIIGTGGEMKSEDLALFKKIAEHHEVSDEVENCNTFSPYVATPEDSLQKDIEEAIMTDIPVSNNITGSVRLYPGNNVLIKDCDTGGGGKIEANIDPIKLSDILFTEMVKFKKSKGYYASSVVDLKEVADNVAKSFIVDYLN